MMDIKEFLRQAELKKQQEEDRLNKEMEQAVHEMNNSTTAIYYPRESGKPYDPKKGYYLTEKEQFENTPTMRFLKLRKVLKGE